MPSPQRLLAATTRSIFESLALLHAQPLGGAPDAAGGAPLGAGAVGARVAFAGVARGAAVEGALAVAVDADVARALAENMLGAARADAGARRDAVGEFANVVCGHVLSALGGPHAVFNLAAPAAAGADDAAGPWSAWLDVDGGRARVTLGAPASLLDPGAEGAAGP